MKSKIKILFLIFVLCIVSCDSTEKYIGMYKTGALESPVNFGTCIELKKNGEGLWAKHNEEVSFTWYIKDNELRINTREGGIMVGKLGNDAFTISLPGDKDLTFVKVLTEN